MSGARFYPAAVMPSQRKRVSRNSWAPFAQTGWCSGVIRSLFTLAQLILPLPLLAARSNSIGGPVSALPNPVIMIIVLAALSLAPFVVIMLTSFVKISVVLSILRNALGKIGRASSRE